MKASVEQVIEEIQPALEHLNKSLWRPSPRQKARRCEHEISRGVEHGYPWLTSHNEMGYRTGYIQVGRKHPWFLQNYNSPIMGHVEAHGGLTWTDKGPPWCVPRFSYHWWVGFDCAHCMDAFDLKLMSDEYRRYIKSRPGLFELMGREGTVRDQEYVEAECLSLCAQAKAAMNFRHQLQS